MGSELVKNFSEHVQPLIPGYKVAQKSQSWLMKLLGKLLFFTPGFMSNFTTTIGNVVYVPDDVWESNDAGTLSLLAHEARHVNDKQHYSMFLFGLGYLLPQVLALLSLLSLLTIWFSNAWLWSLTALVFLAPIPAYFRMVIERRGYLMTLCVIWWTLGERTAYDGIPYIVKQFTGPNYYFMGLNQRRLQGWFERELVEKAKHPSRYDPIYVLVFDFVNSNKGPKGFKDEKTR